MSDALLDLGIDDGAHLAATADEVMRLTWSQRLTRLDELEDDAWRIYNTAVQRHVYDAGRELAGTVILFSGGNDSTTVAHMFRGVATHAGHANTTIGIEATRQYVRDTCAAWGLPLLERTPPRLQDQYVGLVLSTEVDVDGNALGGFPGPGMHWKMWNRLKERAIQVIQNEVVAARGRTHRVVMIAGRRRDESQKRSDVPEMQQKRSRVWATPMVHWTTPDLLTYRRKHGDVPVNETAQLIHMSGECLCGSYASVGERAELDYWFFDDLELIRWLERELLKPKYNHIPVWRKTWGWAAIPELAAMAAASKPAELRPKAAGLCGSCAPGQGALWGDDTDPATQVAGGSEEES